MIRWNEETIFITGGCGLVGSHLCEELESRGARDIRIIDDLSRGSLENLSKLHNFSLAETNLERDVPKFAPGSIVVHLAAKVAGINHNADNQNAMYVKNVLINTHTIEGVARARPKFFFNTSTACIYSATAPVPTPEEYGDEWNPEATNFSYGIAKRIGETHTQIVSREFAIPALSARYFNIVGERDYYDEDTSHVIPALIRRTLSGDPSLVVWGDGSQDRVFVSARDIAQIICDLIERCHDNPDVNYGRAINVGHENAVTIKSLAGLITKLCGVPDLPVVFDVTKPNGYQHRSCDHRLLDSLIGKHQFVPLETSIVSMIADYRARLTEKVSEYAIP